MELNLYKEIPLSKISSNPKNPRKNFSGLQFEELVESIQQKGIIEPVIVRLKKGKKTEYEVVAGERRIRAAIFISSRNPKWKSDIPVLIRELNDEEAFDFMIIENLQREDLTPFEEAQSFKQYFEEKGKGSIPELAIRIGKSAGFIRRKIAALSLPKDILKSWEKGELHFGHLEQLRRLKNKGDLKEAFDYATGNRFGRRGEHIASKRELKEHIDSMAPLLNNALFDLKEEGCTACNQNSDVQRKLWEIPGMEGIYCLNKTCFKQKQNNFLLKAWKKSKYKRSYGTNGFRFSEDTPWGSYKTFSNWDPKPAKKCKACPHYLTLIYIEGKVDEGKVCLGDPDCKSAIGREVKREEIEKGERPRSTWHGEHFREQFLAKRIPEKYKELNHSHIKIARIALFAFIKLDQEILHFMAKKVKLEKSYLDKCLFERIEKMELDEIQELMQQCALKVVMGRYPVTCAGRLTVAKHIGINLMKEFAVNKDYLEKKTIREMLDFGEKSKIFKSKKTQDYLVNVLKKKPDKFNSCKKTELIDLFLKSKVNLVGKVPEEIMPSKENS